MSDTPRTQSQAETYQRLRSHLAFLNRQQPAAQKAAKRGRAELKDTRHSPAHPDLVATLRRHCDRYEIGIDGHLWLSCSMCG